MCNRVRSWSEGLLWREGRRSDTACESRCQRAARAPDTGEVRGQAAEHVHHTRRKRRRRAKVPGLGSGFVATAYGWQAASPRRGFACSAPLEASGDVVFHCVAQRARKAGEQLFGGVELGPARRGEYATDRALVCTGPRRVGFTAAEGERQAYTSRVAIVADALHVTGRFESSHDARHRPLVQMQQGGDLAGQNARVPANEEQCHSLGDGQSERGLHPFGETLQLVIDGPDETHQMKNRIACGHDVITSHR